MCLAVRWRLQICEWNGGQLVYLSYHSEWRSWLVSLVFVWTNTFLLNLFVTIKSSLTFILGWMHNGYFCFVSLAKNLIDLNQTFQKQEKSKFLFLILNEIDYLKLSPNYGFISGFKRINPLINAFLTNRSIKSGTQNNMHEIYNGKRLWFLAALKILQSKLGTCLQCQRSNFLFWRKYHALAFLVYFVCLKCDYLKYRHILIHQLEFHPSSL